MIYLETYESMIIFICGVIALSFLQIHFILSIQVRVSLFHPDAHRKHPAKAGCSSQANHGVVS